MVAVFVFTLGGLTALLLWWVVLGPLFHGLIQGLMSEEHVQGEPQATEARSD